MKAGTFSEAKIVGILKEAEAGMPVGELLRKHGVGKNTFYVWRAKYGGMEAAEVRRVKELEVENGRLKRMYADLALENEAIKAVLNRKL